MFYNILQKIVTVFILKISREIEFIPIKKKIKHDYYKMTKLFINYTKNNKIKLYMKRTIKKYIQY